MGGEVGGVTVDSGWGSRRGYCGQWVGKWEGLQWTVGGEVGGVTVDSGWGSRRGYSGQWVGK